MRVAAREIEAMWILRVITGLMVAALCGCSPFEGTVFELRAPLSPAAQPDPNMAREMEPDERTGPQSVQEDEWTYVAVLTAGARVCRNPDGICSRVHEYARPGHARKATTADGVI